MANPSAAGERSFLSFKAAAASKLVGIEVSSKFTQSPGFMSARSLIDTQMRLLVLVHVSCCLFKDSCHL